MSMMEWAKREVEIASKRERGDYLDHTYSNCSYHKKDKQSKDIEVFITNY